MVPPNLAAVLYLNPVYYLLEVYRDCLLFGHLPSLRVAVIYTVLCLSFFAVGSAFFRAFRGVLLDYE
jgi:ABC-type polysaccharide/polyol phosphate export permease